MDFDHLRCKSDEGELEHHHQHDEGSMIFIVSSMRGRLYHHHQHDGGLRIFIVIPMGGRLYMEYLLSG